MTNLPLSVSQLTRTFPEGIESAPYFTAFVASSWIACVMARAVRAPTLTPHCRQVQCHLLCREKAPGQPRRHGEREQLPTCDRSRSAGLVPERQCALEGV